MFKRGAQSAKHHSKQEEFDQFYDRFHQDMDFQRSRVKFPLEGLNIDGERSESWTKENYPLMKVRIQDVDQKSYKIDTEKTEDSFIQKISLPHSGFYSEYRFKLINRKWYLVYVLDQNL